jgi:hypothetical protein
LNSRVNFLRAMDAPLGRYYPAFRRAHHSWGIPKLVSQTFLALVLTCSAAHAAIIAAVTGSTFFASGIGAGNGQQAVAMGFSTFIGLQNITITAPMSVLFQTTPVTAYLSTQIGPGTTQSNVLAESQLSLPANSSDPNNAQFTTTTLFNISNLAPGNYYISLIETDGTNDAGVGFIFNGSQTITLAPGAKFLGTFGADEQSGTFAPGFSGYGNLEAATLFAGDESFTVTGTLLPEPSCAALAAAFLLASTRRRKILN